MSSDRLDRLVIDLGLLRSTDFFKPTRERYTYFVRDPAHCFSAVGFPPPGRAAAAKGTGVHWLKGDISWVQYVVIQT